jgi:hypothetical protein
MSQYPSFGPQDPFGGSGKDPFGQQPNPSPYQSPSGGPDYGYQSQTPPISPLALISAIVGSCSLMISFFGCCCGGLLAPIPLLGGVAAAIMGHIAMVQIDRNPGVNSGKEWAIVGLATGYPAILISMGWLFLLLLRLFPVFVPLQPGRQVGR